jgi:AbrB family looped-hinge helix DNA binding protein
MTFSAKVTRKGQVTIPKPIRKFLNSNIVEFEIAEDTILLKPVKSIAGSLSNYAKRHVPLTEVRNKVWGKVIKDTH